MKILGHESKVTAKRYVTAAGTATRAAAAQNRLYTLLKKVAKRESGNTP
jgi:integrase/recombinase XerC